VEIISHGVAWSGRCGEGAEAGENLFEQVINDPAAIWRLNRKGRTATHLVSGRTTGGAAVRVAVLYDPVTRTVRPITAVRIG
jgi:hypothetical protein